MQKYGVQEEHETKGKKKHRRNLPAWLPWTTLFHRAVLGHCPLKDEDYGGGHVHGEQHDEDPGEKVKRL